MRQRLQKLIAAAGLASRREAEGWIAAGRVMVNGRVASLGESADPDRDRIEVDGRPLSLTEPKVYLLMHKPAGYVTTLHDPQGRPRVVDLLRGTDQRVYPVGRLDLNSEGLLLLTNDGELAFRIAHPRHKVEKTYLVRVRGLVSDRDLRRLETGVVLEDGPTAPARVEKVRRTRKNTWFEITITEGRNRQVRRMCEAIDHPVIRLVRIRLAFLNLGDLPRGKSRHLSPEEVARLKML